MQLEDYFDFTDYEKHGEIRIQGHRIWMHDFLMEYLQNGTTTPLALRERFDTLSMEEILACMLYYHANEQAMDRMLDNYIEYCRKSREEYERKNPEKVERMRKWVTEAMAKQGQLT